MLKKCVLSSFLHTAVLAAARMSSGSEFHGGRSASTNLVHNCGIAYLLLEADRRPVRVAVLLDILMMFLRCAGHLPISTHFLMHSLSGYDNRSAASATPSGLA